MESYNRLKEYIDNRFEELKSCNQIKYSSNVIPGSQPIIGVKLPEIRKIAKYIAKNDYEAFLYNMPDTYLEYQLLKAYTIGYIKAEPEIIIKYADNFIPSIHDWCVNDAFCQNFTIAKKYGDKIWDWLMTYAEKEEEYAQRVVAVMMLSHYLTSDYTDRVLKVCNRLKHNGYYTKMAVAWCIATAYAKFPEKTHEYMFDNNLDDWTYNKAIQKMIESYRVSDEAKMVLRGMKR